jgi:type IV pilus assembly protein PilM
MGLFSNLFSRSIGIDVGVSSIKVVELSRFGRRVSLKNYAQLEATDPYHKPFRVFQQQSLILSVDKVAKALESCFVKAGIEPKKVTFSVADFLTFFTTFDLPIMNPDEINKAVRFEAGKYIPLPLEKVSLDWQIIREDKENRKEKILVVAIPQLILGQYKEVAQRLSLTNFLLEPETFSLHRLFALEKEPICLIDIGAQSTAITFGQGKILSVSHSLDFSGRQMTQALVESLKVEEAQADQFKEKQGLNGTREVYSVLEPLAATLVQGIKGALANSIVGEKIKKIVLTGGVAHTPGLIDYLADSLKLPVEQGDPFAKIKYPAALSPKLKERSSFLSVATGAALRGFH